MFYLLLVFTSGDDTEISTVALTEKIIANNT